MGAWPKVSVIISTYKRPNLLERALRSVLAQTFKDYEVVVVDDGSDTAFDVVDGIGEEFDQRGVSIRLVNMPHSGRQGSVKNQGIAVAHGSYIAYLDDDNEWFPHHLETLVEKIESGGSDIVYSRWRYKGDGPGTGKVSAFCPPFGASLVGLCSDPKLNFIDTSSILHSKAKVQSYWGGAPWNNQIVRFCDWEFVVRMIKSGFRFAAVDEVTFVYWWHEKQLQRGWHDEIVSSAVKSGNPSFVQWKGEESVGGLG